jgi:hypothetical protein
LGGQGTGDGRRAVAGDRRGGQTDCGLSLYANRIEVLVQGQVAPLIANGLPIPIHVTPASESSASSAIAGSKSGSMVSPSTACGSSGGSIVDAKTRDMIDPALNGLKAKGVPDYTANANVEWDLPFLPAATLTGQVVNTGKQMVDAANTLELKGWTRFDVGARYVALVADKPLTPRFNVDNVANHRYGASAYDTFSTALLQGMPRTFKLSASVHF